jgi:hypothetical protein
MTRLVLILTLVAGFLGPVQGAWAQASLAAAVKAAYLFKFGAFVEWPPSVFDSAEAPLQVCVTGSDPFGATLDQAVKGQVIGNRLISVTRLERVDRNSPCQILFVAPSPRQSVAEALERVRGSPILTVTDNGARPADRGVIDFVLKDNHVRFRIDGRTAGQDGLSISSKLLSLAVSSGGAP